MNYFVDMYML